MVYLTNESDILVGIGTAGGICLSALSRGCKLLLRKLVDRELLTDVSETSHPRPE